MSQSGHDLAVIGGGPGGYPGAIRAAQLGLRVVLFEERGLGGECTLYGCVPTKTIMQYAAASAALARLGAEPGLDPARVWMEARRVAQELSAGIESLLARHGVKVVKARARLVAPGVVEAGGARVEARAVLLAPGSRPVAPPGVFVDNKVVLDNRGWLEKPPARGEEVLVVGGGAVGVEAAAAAAMLGARVVLVEALPRLLPGLPRGLAAAATRVLRRLGVAVETGCPVEEISAEGGGARVRLCGGVRRFSRVLVATGRRPATDGLGLKEAGVRLDEKGYIVVNEFLETSAPGVYAAGDAAGPPMLAHKAIHESLIAATNAASMLDRSVKKARRDTWAIPIVVHLGHVEAVSVGVSLDEARKRGLGVARVRLGWSLYAVTLGAAEGYAALVYEPDTGRVLGYEALAPGAGDSVALAAAAVRHGLTVYDLASTVYPHPERVEQVAEAALAALGFPLHYYTARVSGPRG